MKLIESDGKTVSISKIYPNIKKIIDYKARIVTINHTPIFYQFKCEDEKLLNRFLNQNEHYYDGPSELVNKFIPYKKSPLSNDNLPVADFEEQCVLLAIYLGGLYKDTTLTSIFKYDFNSNRNLNVYNFFIVDKTYNIKRKCIDNLISLPRPLVLLYLLEISKDNIKDYNFLINYLNSEASNYDFSIISELYDKDNNEIIPIGDCMNDVDYYRIFGDEGIFLKKEPKKRVLTKIIK